MRNFLGGLIRWEDQPWVWTKAFYQKESCTLSVKSRKWAETQHPLLSVSWPRMQCTCVFRALAAAMLSQSWRIGFLSQNKASHPLTAHAVYLVTSVRKGNLYSTCPTTPGTVVCSTLNTSPENQEWMQGRLGSLCCKEKKSVYCLTKSLRFKMT